MTGTHSSFDVRDNMAENRFQIELGGGEMAIAEYRLEGGTIAFTHTFVPIAYEGQGVASALVRFALEAARARNLKVIPACAFFAAYFKRHRDVQDLLTASARAKFGLA